MSALFPKERFLLLFLFSLYMVEQRASIHFWLVLKTASYSLSPFMFCTLCSALLLPEYLLHGRGTEIMEM